MPKNRPKTSPYRCGFCRKRLSPLPFALSDLPGYLLLTRPFQCTHCFSVYRRPFALLGYIPGVAWFCGSLSGNPGKPAGMLKPSESHVSGPMAKALATLGKSVHAGEKVLAAIFKPLFRVIWFLPSLLLGTSSKKRRRSRGKFLK